MNEEQMIKELRDRIAWLNNEASASANRAKEKIDQANFYLNIINLLEKKREGTNELRQIDIRK